MSKLQTDKLMGKNVCARLGLHHHQLIVRCLFICNNAVLFPSAAQYLYSRRRGAGQERQLRSWMPAVGRVPMIHPFTMCKWQSIGSCLLVSFLSSIVGSPHSGACITTDPTNGWYEWIYMYANIFRHLLTWASRVPEYLSRLHVCGAHFFFLYSHGA